MLYPAINTEILCPYCGERTEIIVDNCGESQQYIEDCQVCCRPVNFYIEVNESQQVEINVFTDDE